MDKSYKAHKGDRKGRGENMIIAPPKGANQVKCPDCKGLGEVRYKGVIIVCPTCKGKGRIEIIIEIE